MSYQRDQDFRRYFGQLRQTYQLTIYAPRGFIVRHYYILDGFNGGNLFQTRFNGLVRLTEAEMNVVWRDVVAYLNQPPPRVVTSRTPNPPRTVYTSGAPGCSPSLFVIVVIIVGIIFYYGMSNYVSNTSSTAASGNSSSSTDTSSVSDSARATVQQYYDAINNKDYRTAYNMWYDNANGRGQTYDQFVQGYSGTTRDDVTFNSVNLQSDGTANVNITIQATEQGQTETYSASYVLEKVGDSWSIMSGSAQKVG